MPQMGESVFEGTITKWLKKVGEQVTRDEPLFEISTDKVDAEIPAPAAGVLTQIKAEDRCDRCGEQRGRRDWRCGVRRRRGSGCGKSSGGSAEVPAALPLQPHRQSRARLQARPVRRFARSPLVRKLASEHNVDLRQVAGSGAGGRVTRDDILAFVERAKTAPPAAVPPAAAAAPQRCGAGKDGGGSRALWLPTNSPARPAWWNRCR